MTHSERDPSSERLRRQPVAARISWIACFAIAACSGCAITDYVLITDNDQVSNGQGSGIVNTNGKAHIYYCSQWISLWPDGTDNLFSMVDQNAAGDRVITTYNNFSTSTEPSLHSDIYCNPDWQGCAIMTASDPQADDADRFDGHLNMNCSGARSLMVVLSTSRYYGECGRARLSLTDRVRLMNMGRIATLDGSEGLLYRLDAQNTSLRVATGSGETILPLRGGIEAFATGRGGYVDVTNPLIANVGRAYADFQRRHGGRETTVTITYNGLSFEQVLGSGPLGVGSEYASHLNGVFRHRF